MSLKLRLALAALAAALIPIPAHAAAPAQTSAAPAPWVGAWAAAPYDGDPWHTTPTLVDSTLREIVHTSLAGKALRVRFTNEFGTEPLRIDAATIAVSTGDPTGPEPGENSAETAIDPASLHTLSFGGQPSIVIPPGAIALSDPVDLPTPAFANLAISLYLPLQQISNISFHGSAQQDNFIETGNHVDAPRLDAPMKIASWYFLSGVDVEPVAPHAAAVVAFGDSITDGAWVTENSNHRWPDDLAIRLHDNPATADLSVLNEGIGGNCVLIYCVGPNALARFDRDVLSQAGVEYVIVLESINDIGTLHDPNRPDYNLTAQALEQGLSQLVARAHEHGIRVFGATLTPFRGAVYYTERGEQLRETVNSWIRTSGVFDGVIDFDKATRNPDAPLTYLPAYDSGDHLHPGDAGYAAMASAIPLSLFQ
ncbi:MAG TPA: SGNH/GDSL hydrolase family protein [Acidobacteriaceae bacterium]|nr:SGNH/GDSL hydrolase family protein [Acidobacteriaceae bacterium]